MAKTKAPVAPTHRIRSKSMPAPARGRSPSAKSLKKAAKKLEASKDEFTTPPHLRGQEAQVFPRTAPLVAPKERFPLNPPLKSM